MKPSEYDTVFCRQGAHAVPRADINKLYSDPMMVKRIGPAAITAKT